MIRRKAGADLDCWFELARTSAVAFFASGVSKDKAAVSQQSIAMIQRAGRAPAHQAPCGKTVRTGDKSGNPHELWIWTLCET